MDYQPYKDKKQSGIDAFLCTTHTHKYSVALAEFQVILSEGDLKFLWMHSMEML